MEEANRGADSSRGRAGSETFLFFQYGNDSTDDESGFHSHRGGQHRPDHSLPRGAFLESLRAFGVRRVFAGEGLQDHEEGFEDARRGGHLVSIGFPAASENAVCGALECISREQDRVVFAAPRAVDAAEFEVWKAAQPLKEAVRRTKTAVAAVDADVAAADVVATDSAPGHLPEERMRSPSEAESRPGMRYAEADFSLTAACRVAGALKEFNLAEKTPLECMMFLSELKKMIHSI